MLINQRFIILVSLAGVGGTRHQKILFKNFYIYVPDGQGRNKFKKIYFCPTPNTSQHYLVSTRLEIFLVMIYDYSSVSFSYYCIENTCILTYIYIL